MKKVLPVAEGAKFGLLLFMLKLFVRRTKVEDEVLEGEDDPLERECHGPWRLVLSSQSVQTPEQADVFSNISNRNRFVFEKFNLLDELPEEANRAVDHTSSLGLFRLRTGHC